MDADDSKIEAGVSESKDINDGEVESEEINNDNNDFTRFGCFYVRAKLSWG